MYDMLPPGRRKFKLYRKLTGMAMKLLKEGREQSEVVVELMIFIRLPKRVRKKKTNGKAAEAPVTPVISIATTSKKLRYI